MSEKHLTPLVKFTVLTVVCPPPTKYLGAVAFPFLGHLYPYSLQKASEAESSKVQNVKFSISPYLATLHYINVAEYHQFLNFESFGEDTKQFVGLRLLARAAGKNINHHPSKYALAIRLLPILR